MYKEIFQERLKQARIKKAYTQDEVAAETGIRQNLISKYERGTLEPSIETIGILIDLYEEDANYILGTRGKNK